MYFSVAFLGKGKKICYAYNENIEVAQLWHGHLAQNGSSWKAFGNLKEIEKWIFYKEVSGSLKNRWSFWVVCHDMYVNSYYVAHNASLQGGDFLTVKSVAINSEFFFPSQIYDILAPSHDYCFFLLFSPLPPSPSTFSEWEWGTNKRGEAVVRYEEASNCFGRLLATGLQIRRVACSKELL